MATAHFVLEIVRREPGPPRSFETASLVRSVLRERCSLWLVRTGTLFGLPAISLTSFQLRLMDGS